MSSHQVYFDINGTLFDPAVLGEPVGDPVTFPKELLSDAVTLAMALTLAGDYRDFSDIIEAAAERRLRIAGMAEKLGDVLEKAKEMPPFAEAREAIAVLSANGLPCGALSNSSRETVVSLLDRAGLELGPVVGTDQVRAFKPHPDVYAAAVKAAGSQPDEVMLVTAHGWDALGAKRAGLGVAWISSRERVPVDLGEQADVIAADLLEAARRIAEL